MAGPLVKSLPANAGPHRANHGPRRNPTCHRAAKPCTTTPEGHVPKKLATPQQEKSQKGEQAWTPLAATRKPAHSADPAQSKNKMNELKKKKVEGEPVY